MIPRCFSALFVAALMFEIAAAAMPSELNELDLRLIRAAHEEGRHEFILTADGGYQARHPGQGWSMAFDESGFSVTPDGGGWTWGLELAGWSPGLGDVSRMSPKESGAPDDGIVERAPNRLVFQRAARLEEWFLNDERGLEQGWTVRGPPGSGTGAEELRLRLRVRGSLQPVVGGVEVGFVDEGGREVLVYDGLKAWDAEGRDLEVRFEQADGGFEVVTDLRGVTYPVTIDPLARQHAYLKASNTGTMDGFGHAVAISGDTVVVGAPGESSSARGVNGNQVDNSLQNSGAAYVFTRSGGRWRQQAYLKASNPDMEDVFGVAVAISGDVIVVGAVHESSGSPGVNGDQTDNSVAQSGAAYVFERSGGRWRQRAYLKAGQPGAVHYFGGSVGVSGDTVVVGAKWESGAAVGVNGDESDQTAQASGAAYVFQRQGSTWVPQAYLKASNTGAGDQFGEAVAIFGDHIVVGASGEDSDGSSQANNSASGAGAAYVFRRAGPSWLHEGYLKAANAEAQDAFGKAVAISGDTIVVGAPGEAGNGSSPANNSLPAAGAAYVFVREGNWLQQAYLKASNPDAGDGFGGAVAVSGDRLAAAAIAEASNATGVDGNQNNNSLANAGAAYVFHRANTIWQQQAYLKASNTGVALLFGYAIGLSGDTLVTGTPVESSSATGVNGDPFNTNAVTSGAAYVFDLARPLGGLVTSGQSAGVNNLFHNRPRQPAVGFRFAFLSGLGGSAAGGGANLGLFSNLASLTQFDLVQRRRDPVGGQVQLPPNARVSALEAPVCNREPPTLHALFLARVSGNGLNNGNNQVLYRDNGVTPAPLMRTGLPLIELGGARLRRMYEVAQAANGNIIVPYQLHRGGGVNAGNDSGVLVLDGNGGVVSNALREGAQHPANALFFFGQFRPTASVRAGGVAAFISQALVPSVSNVPTDAFFSGNFILPVTQGSQAPGIGGGAGLGRFLGVCMTAADANDSNCRLRTLLTGVPVSSNEALWSGAGGGTLLLRKGQQMQGNPGGAITRFLRFWSAQGDQTLALVRLGGPGVNAGNNQALILHQAGSPFTQVLLRSGAPAPGFDDPKVRIRRLLVVEANSSVGHYVVLASLSGVPANRNLALFGGRSNLLWDHQRLPRRLLSKGSLYDSGATELGMVRGIVLEPVAETTGAGGRGLRQVVGSSGHTACTLLGDNGRRELVVVAP